MRYGYFQHVLLLLYYTHINSSHKTDKKFDMIWRSQPQINRAGGLTARLLKPRPTGIGRCCVNTIIAKNDRQSDERTLIHSSHLFNLKLIHTATPDKTAAPACRPPPPRRRPGRQLRLAARPPTRSDVVRHAKCKHAVDCCIWLNPNFFTERHATRVIYQLTVQTLLDGIETQFTPSDTTPTGPSCLAGAVA